MIDRGRAPSYHSDNEKAHFYGDEKKGSLHLDGSSEVRHSSAADRAAAGPSSSPLVEQVTWHITGRTSEWHVQATDSSTNLYMLSFSGEAPQVSIIGPSDGGVISSASSKGPSSRVFTLKYRHRSKVCTSCGSETCDLHKLELRPADGNGNAFVCYVPALDRDVTWTREGLTGLHRLVCKDSDGNEIADWQAVKIGLLNWKKVGTLAFSRWVGVREEGRDPVRVREEVLLSAMVLARMMEMARRRGKGGAAGMSGSDRMLGFMGTGMI